MDYDLPPPFEFNRDLPEGASVGSPIAEFTFSPMRRIGSALLGVGVALIGIALLALAWFGGNGAGSVKITFIGLVALSFGGVLLLNALRQHERYAWLGTSGVALLEWENVEWAAWKEIHTLWDLKLESAASGIMAKLHAKAQGKARVVKAECGDGKQLVFDAFFGDIARLAKIMKAQTLEHLLPASMAALDAGETVQFGPLALDAEGLLRPDGEELAWFDLKSIVNKSGVTIVTAAGKWRRWFSCPQGEIPNLHVLMALVDKYRDALGDQDRLL
jgi:hypothetical protein